MFQIPSTVKLLVALTFFTAVYLRGEAADTCPATTTSCIPGLPGRDGRDGTPGRDGRDGSPGPPGSLTTTEQQQLKEMILEMIREEICNLSNCNTTVLQPEPLQCKGNTTDNPASSCKEIYDCDPSTPSGSYWVSTTTGPVQVFCEMETNNCGNITGGWMRAAYIDMTNESNTCPQGLTYTVVSSTRMCTRSNTGIYTCSSVTFPTHRVPYTKVCGRARGYKYYSTPAFLGYHYDGQTTLDSAYVSGLSVTYGSPRSHIWTFAAGYSETLQSNANCCNCPCALYPGLPAPRELIGENYFCEAGENNAYPSSFWYLEQPLWDSQGCVTGSTCCDRGGPWFTTTLSQEASDDIEMRMCTKEESHSENFGVEQLEIFIR